MKHVHFFFLLGGGRGYFLQYPGCLPVPARLCTTGEDGGRVHSTPMSQSATQNAFRFDTGGLRQESERVAVTRKCILALPQCRGLSILFVKRLWIFTGGYPRKGY